MYYCPRCKKDLPEDRFYINKARSSGLSSYCKKCHNDHYYKDRKEEVLAWHRNYYKNNREKRRKKDKDWYERNKDYVREYGKKNYLKNREKRLKQSKEWFLRNREYSISYIKKWRKENGDKLLKYRIERDSRLRRNGGVIKVSEWIELKEKYGNKCLACGVKNNITLDHVVPVVKGGKHEIENVQPLCVSCNAKKHTKIIDYR